MSAARERILGRLRQARDVTPRHRNPVQDTDAQWRARQPPLGDLAERFAAEQHSVGGDVRRVPGWSALPAALAGWLGELGLRRIIVGTEPRLEPLHAHLAADGRFALVRYERPVEAQRADLFAADCGITTSRGAVAETGSVILIPTPQEPRLLSLAPEAHLAIVERSALLPTLADFIATGVYQAQPPSNLVLISGASRTADIELTLAIGVHGPKRFLVALVE